jgi:hypothetical protein
LTFDVKQKQTLGPANVRYAIFKTPRTRVCVPWYCLTRETRARIAELEGKGVMKEKNV